jgi:hypothetical protein
VDENLLPPRKKIKSSSPAHGAAISKFKARQATPAGELRRSKRIQENKVAERKSVAPEAQRKQKSVTPGVQKRQESAVPDTKKKQKSAAAALQEKQKEIALENLPEIQKKQQVAAPRANEHPKFPIGYFTSDLLCQSAGNNMAGINRTEPGVSSSSRAVESANINNQVLPTIESRKSSPARSLRNGKGKGKQPMNNRSQSPSQSSNDRYCISKSSESEAPFNLTRIQANLSEYMEKMMKAQHDMAERIKDDGFKLENSYEESDRLEKELQEVRNELESMERGYLEYRGRELRRRQEIKQLKADIDGLKNKHEDEIATLKDGHEFDVYLLDHKIKELRATLASEEQEPYNLEWIENRSNISYSTDWLNTEEGSSIDTHLFAWDTWSSQAPDEQPSAELEDFAEYVKQKGWARSFDHYRRGRAINGFKFREDTQAGADLGEESWDEGDV